MIRLSNFSITALFKTVILLFALWGLTYFEISIPLYALTVAITGAIVLAVSTSLSRAGKGEAEGAGLIIFGALLFLIARGNWGIGSVGDLFYWMIIVLSTLSEIIGSLIETGIANENERSYPLASIGGFFSTVLWLVLSTVLFWFRKVGEIKLGEYAAIYIGCGFVGLAFDLLVKLLASDSQGLGKKNFPFAPASFIASGFIYLLFFGEILVGSVEYQVLAFVDLAAIGLGLGAAILLQLLADTSCRGLSLRGKVVCALRTGD